MTQTIPAPEIPARIAPPHYHRYITLTTFRRNGEPIPTVVWFAAANGKLYIRTSAESGKVRRIQHTDRVLVAASSISGQLRGLTIVGRARMLPQLEAQGAERALDAKYGLLAGAYRLMDAQTPLVVIEVTPDPGPGTADLLLEHIPDAQMLRELARNVAIGAGAVLAAVGLVAGLRRLGRRATA